MDAQAAADLAAAARCVKRAQAALRTATQAVAQARDRAHVVAARTCRTPDDAHQISELVRQHVHRHGPADVVVITHSPPAQETP